MKDMMEYKGYYGSVHYNDEDKLFYGKLEFIQPLVSYEGTDVASLRKDFEDAVDDYLDLCKEEKIEPEKPFRGNFNVNIDSKLHRDAVLYAEQMGINLNTLVSQLLSEYLEKRGA